MGKPEIITKQSGLLVGKRKDQGHMCKGALLSIRSVYLIVCKGEADGRLLLLQAEVSGMHLFSQADTEGGGERCRAQRMIRAKAGGCGKLRMFRILGIIERSRMRSGGSG